MEGEGRLWPASLTAAASSWDRTIRHIRGRTSSSPQKLISLGMQVFVEWSSTRKRAEIRAVRWAAFPSEQGA